MALGAEGEVLLWDVRQTKTAAKFEESHMEDSSVTQVHFHPTQNHFLVSGDEDGLICAYDCTQMNDEDEAVVSVLNTEQSVSKLGFFGAQSDMLYCITQSEMLSLWNLQRVSHWLEGMPDC